MHNFIGQLCAAVEAAILERELEVTDVPAFARGFSAGAGCTGGMREDAARWAAGYVQREARKAAQYRHWLRAA